MFRVYIVYIEGTEEEEESTEALLKDEEDVVLLDKEDKEANIITVFIVSKAEYDVREVI